MVSTNQLRTIKYILIVILSIGLYFTWLQKDKFENTTLKLKEKTKELKLKIQNLKNDLERKYSQKTTKTVEIIIPKEKKNYLDIISDINYTDLDFKKSDNINNSNIKIKPNIQLDDNKDIEKVEVKIQTKF